MSVITFSAIPYDAGVLLEWNPGYGTSTSTSSNLVEITIQYSETADANVVQNTPPYAVRMLRQPQGENNVLFHPYLRNGTTYTYSIFAHYLDTGAWEGPIVSNSVIPVSGLDSPCISGSLSFSKLETNTILTSNKDSRTELVVWLSENQQTRRDLLEQSLTDLKPAHTRITVSYENYYVADTTTSQFTSGFYDTTTYTVEEGTIKLLVPTIDSSFSGKTLIYGG